MGQPDATNLPPLDEAGVEHEVAAPVLFQRVLVDPVVGGVAGADAGGLDADAVVLEADAVLASPEFGLAVLAMPPEEEFLMFLDPADFGSGRPREHGILRVLLPGTGQAVGVGHAGGDVLVRRVVQVVLAQWILYTALGLDDGGVDQLLRGGVFQMVRMQGHALVFELRQGTGLRARPPVQQ